jgi:hypothetical protein
MTEKQAFEFAEWIGYNYIRLHGCWWVHRYEPQRVDKYRSTEQLYKFWTNMLTREL